MSNRDSFFTLEEIRQRLSISTLVFDGFRPIGEAALEELARHGIRSIELIESPEQYDLAEEHAHSATRLGRNMVPLFNQISQHRANG